MSFDQLKRAILEDADKKARAVALDLQEQLKAQERRIKNRVRKIEETIIDQGEIKGKEEAGRLYQETTLRMRALVLASKQEEMDKTKEMFKREFLTGDKEKTTSYLKQLLALIPDTPGTIVPGSIHGDQIKNLLNRKDITIENKNIKDEGGFVYRNENMELNMTTGYLVDRLFEAHRSEIAKTLFD